MTKNKICQNIFNIQRQFFESKKTINVKERIKSLKKLKIVISKMKKIINALEMDLAKVAESTCLNAIIYNELNYFIKKTKKWTKRKRFFLIIKFFLVRFYSLNTIQLH